MNASGLVLQKLVFSLLSMSFSILLIIASAFLQPFVALVTSSRNMDAIVAKRNLANEKDTAQMYIDRSIQRLSASSRESEFVFPILREGLYGEVNLSALMPLNIVSIRHREAGNITEIRGLPRGLQTLQMESQLLTEIRDLPPSLNALILDGNHIENIDVSSLRRLKVLSLKNNRIKLIGRLPESLEELYLDNNQISRLDLEELPNLRVLHCRNNRTLRIENIPASLVDLSVEEGNPLIVLDYAFLPSGAADQENKRARGTEAEFAESLHKYFKLKSKYEEDAKAMRERVREQALKRGLGEKRAQKMVVASKPKCVNCKRPVRTIFKIKDDRLIGYCGDATEPCGLRIEIFKGRFESDDAFARETRNGLLETKEKIIKQKMDVLFNYSSEEETVSKFKDLIEEYNLFSFLHKTDLDMREDKRFNAHKKELIKGKFAQRHYFMGSLVLAVMVLGSIGGMAVTYLNNGKLFVGPHLLAGLGMTALIAIAASLAPLMQQGNLIARKAHVGMNMLVMTLFLWQAVSGVQIVNKIWTNR
jgi:Leucine-rich repeat (LRR) protein